MEKALRIYTPSLSEKALADFLADRCDDLGFRDIHQDEVGNLIATKGSGEPNKKIVGSLSVPTFTFLRSILEPSWAIR